MGTVAVLAILVLVYTYAGYPALVALLARLRPLHPARDPSWEPTVTVCMPVFNTAAFLEDKLASLAALDYPREKLEILVCSDGSTDGSDEVLEAWKVRLPGLRVLREGCRRGKPAALNRMAAEASGEVLLLTDARQPLVPGALRALLELLADPKAACVTGNLTLRGQTGGGAYWRYERWIRKQEARFRSVVGMTGSISAMRRSDFAPLPEDIILDDVWIPMRLRLRDRWILFAEDAVAYDVAFEDDREFGRKVRTLAGNYQLFSRMPALLSPLSNPSWFETMSHKVLRLLCPWALAALALASVFGFVGEAGAAARLHGVLLLGQGAFYGAALLGGQAGRLGSLARTFVVLNAAAVVGLWRQVTGGQRVTW